MANRLAVIQERMAMAPFDLLALVPGANYYYATGAPLHASERLNLLLIPKRGAPMALAPSLEAPYLRPLGIQVHEWRDEEGPLEVLKAMLQALGIGSASVGIEYGTIKYGESEWVRSAAPDISFRPADGFMMGLRAIKDAEELAAIRRAIEVTERGLQRALKEIRVGQTEREIASAIQLALLHEGAERMAFGPLVVSGPRSAEPHAGPSDRAIEPGDVMIIDWGASLGHYSGDITRCAAVGPVPDEITTIYDLCLAANAAARAAVRPGATGHEIDAAARAVIENGGYGQYFIHRTGHGLGLDNHEPPYMVAGNEQPLSAGNVFTIEPGIYVPGLGGVRVEDNVLVTESGGQSLTTFSRELIRVG